ncbi:unnamed protein product [Laminaria digitata]
MESDRPKQFLELQGETVLEHSLKLFLSLKGVSQLVLVLDERYRPMLEDLQGREPRLVFADPGTERQDSVYNALQKVDVDASLVCIHDAARPLATKDSVYKVRGCRIRMKPFRTDRTPVVKDTLILIPSNLSPKWECGPTGVNCAFAFGRTRSPLHRSYVPAVYRIPYNP